MNYHVANTRIGRQEVSRCRPRGRKRQSILFLSSQSAKRVHKIYSLTRCNLTVNECDWCILAGSDERINSYCLTRNLRYPLHTGDEACKTGILPGFETQGRRHQKSKDRNISGSTTRTDVLRTFIKNYYMSSKICYFYNKFIWKFWKILIQEKKEV